MSFKRVQKSRVIANEIERQIRSGHLQPGDSLASVKSLCASYRAGQNTVERALRELEERRLIEIKARSGCYVLPTEGAAEQITARRPAAARSATQPTPRGTLLDFMQPQTDASERLAIYVSELSDSAIQTWRRVLEDFDQAKVDLLTCQDGRLEDVIRERPLDIIQSTPALLSSVGGDRFAPIDETGPLDSAWWKKTLPIVRERRSAADPLLGVPFQITVPYLFVNLDLAESLGADTAPTSIKALIENGSKTARAARMQGAESLTIPGVLDLLWPAGGVGVDKAGDIVVNDKPALAVLEQLHGSDLALTGPLDGVLEFIAGRLMYLIHCSFEAPEMLSRAGFRWQAIPIPVARGIRSKAWLTVLALSRTTEQPDLCAALIRHLTSPEVQACFARQHGNLSVLSSLVDDVATETDHVTAATARTALKQSTLSVPEKSWLQAGKLNLAGDRVGLIQGQLLPQDALRRLHWCASLNAPNEAVSQR